MANDKAFKVKHGLSATRYLQTVGTKTETTTGYDFSSLRATYKYADVSEDGTPIGAHIGSNGTKLYMIGNATDTVYQYTMSAANDLSTATYDSVSLNVNGDGAISPKGITFKPDGTKMYVLDSTLILEYNLSTAWDLSTATFTTGDSYDTTTQTANCRGIQFTSDGTTMFVADLTSDAVYQYSLSTAWDITTASYASKSMALSGNASFGEFAFNADGTLLWVMELTGEIVEYSLTTGFDISTGSATGKTYQTNFITVSGVYMFHIYDSGKKLAAGGSQNDRLNQFDIVSYTQELDLSTGTHFNIDSSSATTTVSFTNSPASGKAYAAQLVVENSNTEFNVDNEEYDFKLLEPFDQIGGSGNGIYIGNNGTKFYISSDADDIVYQYTLGTAYDISTATYDSKFFDTTAQDGNIEAVFFKPDGTEMYTVGTSTDIIRQYSLSTAWDVSTATYSYAKNTSAEETNPRGLFLGDSGTKLYLIGTTGDDVNQYTLSTAWQVNTATFDKTFSVAPQDGTPTDVWFSSDGKTMLILGISNSGVYQYKLSTAWDVGTADFDVAIYPRAELVDGSGSREGFWIAEDQRKLYIIGPRHRRDGFSRSAVLQWSIIDKPDGGLTWPSSIKWHKGTAPTDNPRAGTKDLYTFITTDGGTTYYGKKSGEYLK